MNATTRIHAQQHVFLPTLTMTLAMVLLVMIACLPACNAQDPPAPKRLPVVGASKNQSTVGASKNQSTFQEIRTLEFWYSDLPLREVFGDLTRGSAWEWPELELSQIGTVSTGDRSSSSTVRQVAGEEELIPLVVPETPENVELSTNNELANLVATGAELEGVLRIIADHHGMNLVIGPDVSGPVTVSIRGARLEEVLDAICGVSGFKWHRVGNLLYVTGTTNDGINPSVQGRFLRLYNLNYISSKDVEAIINGLLSPIGNAYSNEAAPDDQLRTRETLVVEDVLEAHTRIEQYLSQADVPPKQVLIEAHILQIALNDENRHGVNLESIARLDGTRIRLTGSGFAEDNPGGPSLALRVDGTDMNSLIELVQNNTNSRTLASPKLSVVNHQEAQIQIGQRLPYSVSTTTETATVQNVQFLEVGIVLSVRPVITDDGNILMNVLPKVSGGTIGDNGFPEEDTTEVSTTVLMPDGGGIIIGGLIREENTDNRSMIPYLGRVPLLGNLFKRRNQEIRRNELIVALVTRVMHDHLPPRQQEVRGLETTLPPYAVEGMLQSATSTWIDGSQDPEESKIQMHSHGEAPLMIGEKIQ